MKIFNNLICIPIIVFAVSGVEAQNILSLFQLEILDVIMEPEEFQRLQYMNLTLR